MQAMKADPLCSTHPIANQRGSRPQMVCLHDHPVYVHSTGHCVVSSKASSTFSSRSNRLQCRFVRVRAWKDVEDTIACSARVISLTPGDHSDKPSRLNDLMICIQDVT